MRASPELVSEILARYHFDGSVLTEKPFLEGIEDAGWVKLIFQVTLSTGANLVIKILHEDQDPAQERQKIEQQSRFSERMRLHGIPTPRRYQADGAYCTPVTFEGRSCFVTVEDFCGEELTYITEEIAHKIGALMARMHLLALADGQAIGCGTLFSAAYENDVDCFDDFCQLCADPRADQQTVTQIKHLHDAKLQRLREKWHLLPKAAVQGDISINNLVWDGHSLTVFDYNNAGDEVLVSDLVMEGLLTAYEMELPEGVTEAVRERLFPAFVRGYLAVRPLSSLEQEMAWEAYTLWHGIWFTRIVYHEHSLQKCIERDDWVGVNERLTHMLQDMLEENNGMFAV